VQTRFLQADYPYEIQPLPCQQLFLIGSDGAAEEKKTLLKRKRQNV
jgi:hypothetical protein